ncbi:efflux RND transporter permease subunit [Ningiella sp. W23]|uniref:efflux RND transporter permease subunit n=1 Tax=Ningiella sp. W23 TaxID=3023715 RepID=UPI0037584C2E
MNFSKKFIDRPILAGVLSILVTIVGIVSYFGLPITQYPEIAPPTIVVTATYPGANAQTVAQTVATPIEQEVNGIEGMLYMMSQSTSDGVMSLTITFELGTDLDMANVLVQNRVSLAEPLLPEEVRRLGVTTRKNSPNMLMVVNLFSPDGTYDQDYIGNYVVLKLRDQLRRVDGVGDTLMFGAAPYSMRIWLDPDLVNNYELTAGDVIASIRAQNVQVASGVLNQAPQVDQNVIEYNIQTQGRLQNPEEFENIIIKSVDGKVVRLGDVGRVELGVQSYATKGYLGEFPSVALPIFQRPGSNAVETSDSIIALMETLKEDFPPGLDYDIAYNPTNFIEASIEAVEITFYEAVFLVVLVIIVFLQSWRAAIIPIIAIPISLIGTFAVMAALGFTLNTLTLFGLVLAIGIVVDDAIVVVENMERNMQSGMNTRDAARKTMEEVGGALIGMGLVLFAVFLPTAFMEGISGQFYRQFGVTIAVATIISVAVSLTLSPALAKIMMRPHSDKREGAWYAKPINGFFGVFNKGLDWLSEKYASTVAALIKFSALALIIYVGLMAATAYLFTSVPSGFIPPQDKGYFIVAIQLPNGYALSETDVITNQVTDILLNTDGISSAVAFTGFAGATFTNATNAAAIFPVLEDFEVRNAKGLSYQGILDSINAQVSQIKEAFIVVIPPPPVDGIGNAGGFKMMIQDKGGRGLAALEQATWGLAMAAMQDPAIASAFTFYENGTPQIFLDIDRERAEKLNVPVTRIFEALEVFIGSTFVNDFNYLGRTFRVTAQADAQFRLTPDDALRLRVRSDDGHMVPIGSVATISDTAASSRVPRYNLFPSAGLIGERAPGFSTGQALDAMERLAADNLPDGFDYEWTEIAYQERNTGNTAAFAFAMAVLFVFLLLAALYESWTLPLAVILIVPMCLFSSITGIWISGMENNILTQIGFIVLVGLASKNAILIVEFARELESSGKATIDAAVEAARLRLRPILMTSFAFILGVIPLVIAQGAGAEMRQAIGVAVFSGMLGVTLFGLLFTPVFYVLCRKLSKI